jgi:hypothetical protein
VLWFFGCCHQQPAGPPWWQLTATNLLALLFKNAQHGKQTKEKCNSCPKAQWPSGECPRRVAHGVHARHILSASRFNVRLIWLQLWAHRAYGNPLFFWSRSKGDVGVPIGPPHAPSGSQRVQKAVRFPARVFCCKGTTFVCSSLRNKLFYLVSFASIWLAKHDRANLRPSCP